MNTMRQSTPRISRNHSTPGPFLTPDTTSGADTDPSGRLKAVLFPRSSECRSPRARVRAEATCFSYPLPSVDSFAADYLDRPPAGAEARDGTSFVRLFRR